MFAGQRPAPLSLKRTNTTTRDPWSEPSSPSSLSWADKSTTELVVLLKTAHASLREKDKDLTLAAELGHYLLENNIALKSQYDELLHEQELHSECASADNDDLDNDNAILLVSQHQAHQRVLNDLQDKNIELQRLLDDAQQQSDKLQTVHDKKARELEYDITLLQDHLAMASQRIEEMEDDQHYRSVRQRQQYQHTDQRLHQHSENQRQQQQQHDSLLMELRDKISKLECENNQLVQTRQSVQDRLDNALSDVNALQRQFHLDEWTKERYTQLNDAYQQQFNQIAQLSLSLEEHRNALSSLTDHGNYDYHYSDGSVGSMPTGITDVGDLYQSGNNHNLMAELEMVWYRDQLKTTPNSGTTAEASHQQQKEAQQQFSSRYQHNSDEEEEYDDNDDDGYSSLVSDGIKLHQQYSFDSTIPDLPPQPSPSPPPLHAPLPNYTDNSDSQVCDHVNSNTNNDDDDLFGPQNAMDALTSYNLYPDLIMAAERPKEPSLATMGMVRKAQRWCRFAIVLTVAALINAFEGPDAMLDEMY